MIRIEIDELLVDFTSIWYHSQASPKPGGHNYTIEITKDEKELIEIMESMLLVSINDIQFPNRGIDSGSDSTYNLVRYTLNWLDKINNTSTDSYKVEWVFNNIVSVSVGNEKILIRGIASKKW